MPRPLTLLVALLAPALLARQPSAALAVPSSCLCWPPPSSPQVARCSDGALLRVPRCVPSDVAELHVAYPLVQSVMPNALISSEFFNLQVVLFDHNRVQYLVGDEFREMSKLSMVNLSHNMLEGPLPGGLFDKNTMMECLDLSYNLGLGVIRENSTTTLVASSSLRFLDVSHCGLVHLSLDTPSLETLDVSWNSLKYIPTGTFSNMPHLRILDLSRNMLCVLENGSFKGLVRIVRVNLSYNMLSGPLPPDLLSSCPNITHLDLSCNYELRNNENNDVPLVTSSSLLKVNVSQCGLHHLCLDTPALLALNASYNHIRDLHDVAFSGMQSLELLDLTQNKLTSLSVSLPSVRVLNLSKNALERIDDQTFGYMPELRFLDLSFNRIIAIDSLVLPSLRFLNLSVNSLPMFSDYGISVNETDIIMDLSYNSLSDIQIGLQYEELILRGNPFHCSCKMLSEVGEWLRRTADNKTRRCSEPKMLKGLLWTHFLSNHYCILISEMLRTTTQTTVPANVTMGKVKSEAVATVTQSGLQSNLKSEGNDSEAGMSAYNATMVALVVWGLVAYPCVVALRRGSRAVCRSIKRHRSSVASCVRGGGDDAPAAAAAAVTAPAPGAGPRRAASPRPVPPPRPRSLALQPPTSPRVVLSTPERPLPPSGYDVLQFEAPRYRTPLPHYQQVVATPTPTPTPTPLPTPTSDDCCEMQPLCLQPAERASPNVYVRDPLQPLINDFIEEPLYAEIYDVVRR